MALRPDLIGQIHLGVKGSEQPGHVAVRDGHPLRGAGGPGGVDDVGDLVGGRYRHRRTRLTVNRRVGDVDDQQTVSIQTISQLRRRDRRDRCGIGEHEIHSCRGHGRIDRNVGGADFHDRQNRYHGLG